MQNPIVFQFITAVDRGLWRHKSISYAVYCASTWEVTTVFSETETVLKLTLVSSERWDSANLSMSIYSAAQTPPNSIKSNPKP